jgi:predicted transcriptional regulator
MAVMISINPPYTEMIMSGYKWMEFRNKIIKTMLEFEFDEIIYIYETKNKGGQGKVIGECHLLSVHELLYTDDPQPTEELIMKRFKAFKELYYEWCEKHGYNPNHNEGYFKNKKFKTYTEKIGWGGNYALCLGYVMKYDIPKDLLEFEDSKGNPLKRPPQNMFRCKQRQKNQDLVKKGIDRNFVKINDEEYLMVSEPQETDESMKQRGFIKVTNEEFDRLFLLYQEVIDGNITSKDIKINQID